jgi:S-adenosylmethionine:tRNA ribosyltransferase-isomerase
MRTADLLFHRPDDLMATRPAEAEGRARDSGRLMVSSRAGHRHGRFADLADLLRPGDLLVVNRSATLPASLTASGVSGAFTLNLSTNFGGGLWLAEPRLSQARSGPVPGLSPGDTIRVGGLEARLIRRYPGLPRLWFVQFAGDACLTMQQAGHPIRYGYLDGDYDLRHFQTIFATVPGSAEMPSASYPITQKVLDSLKDRGVRLAGVLLHTGVSSLEVEDGEAEDHTMYPEPYKVPTVTARAVNAAKDQGRRVIAVGTTVVRALESAWDGEKVRASRGFTRLFIHPKRGVHVVDGLLTGLHDPVTSHLMMLYAVAGEGMIRDAYSEAIHEGYRWHEFGDSHLILS